MSTITPVSYLPPIDASAAQRTREEIDALLMQINSHELRLAKSYAKLGSALKEVKAQQFWISYGYDRFSSYLESVWKAIGKKRSQVYAILSVSETLLPKISESELENIGITKAFELQRLVKQGGNIQALLPEPDIEFEEGMDSRPLVRLMDYAARPKVTAAQLRVKVNELLHIFEPKRGEWFELPGFYATPDERKEVSDFWELGRKVLQIDSEHEYEVHKEVFLAAMRESVSTWRGELADAK